MEYSSQIRVESKTCEGVAFTILRMTWKRRAALRECQAAAQARLDGLRKEMSPLSKEYSAAVAAAKARVQPERDILIAAGATAEEAAKTVPLGVIDFAADKYQTLMQLSEQIEQIDREGFTPEAVRFGLVTIEGLTIDGEVATFDLLTERGPDELYAEIALAVAGELGLLPDEAANLESPSTSAGAVDGSATPGTAAPAGKLDTITSAAALSSTDPASVSVSSTA